ncbi:MAG: HEAT repeat domain-containing protein [Verrucomicrobia bacterium]|nr:HEAT repeat domain-containing protein [Verrucomicrobiota bacterium]
MIRVVARWLKGAVKIAKYIVPPAVVVAGGWWVYQNIARDGGGTISGLAVLTSSRSLSHDRTGPGGVRYSVDTALASYRLAMRPEDAHSRRVFASYGAALRHAREHQLPSIPSTSLVLATCAATDYRLHAALELALDRDPTIGRRVLLRQWLAATLAHRQQAPPAARPAYDRAIHYLATAVLIQGDEPQVPADLARPTVAEAPHDPPLGPWATSPELGLIWRRDRFLSNGLPLDDDTAAAAVAVLARTQPAGWQQQSAVSQVLYGKPAGLTFESLAARLARFPDADLTGPAAVACVRAAGDSSSPAPAALAFATTPEHAVLEPLGMKAWDDPLGTLIAAIRAGKISLEPGPDAGFYRHRWFALETLAAPGKAPESYKLQLSADYQRRWQRAFAAGFAEGRSGFVKRLPITVLGMSDPGTIPLDVAPEFSAEPAPIVYLRLARAYRMLADGLAAANGEIWRELRDADGNPVAAELQRKIERLYGLAAKVYREVGHPLPLLENETQLDFAAAEAAAAEWLAGLESDPDVTRDARLLVTLASDGCGSYRCPAVLGVRLEPVVYSWLEEPEVSGNIKPRFVPARYWLASPIPATLTVTKIPTPAEFRHQCDSHPEVRELCRAFGHSPPQLQTPERDRWPWLLAGLALLGGAVVAFRWWWRRTKRTRWLTVGGVAAALAGLLAMAVYHPPLWLLRWGWVKLVAAPKGIAQMAERGAAHWQGEAKRALFISLLSDPEAQVRYCGAMLPLLKDDGSPCRWTFTAAELVLLRSRVNDEVPEVGWAAWRVLCEHQDELPFLLEELARTTTSANVRLRLYPLRELYPTQPAVIAAALKLAADPIPEIRAETLPNLAGWKPAVPALTEAVRAATTDPAAVVRRAAAYQLGGSAGTAADVPRLLALWQDPSEAVRKAAFRAMEKRTGKSNSAATIEPPPRWTDAPIQQALIRYAAIPTATFDEKLTATRRLAEPAVLREWCRRLLPEAEQLPDVPVAAGPSRHPRSRVLALLATRWVLADRYAELTKGDRSEQTSDLASHPALLTRLTRCIAENRDPAATLAVLRETANQPNKDRGCARALLDQLEPPPAK